MCSFRPEGALAPVAPPQPGFRDGTLRQQVSAPTLACCCPPPAPPHHPVSALSSPGRRVDLEATDLMGVETLFCVTYSSGSLLRTQELVPEESNRGDEMWKEPLA